MLHCRPCCVCSLAHARRRPGRRRIASQPDLTQTMPEHIEPSKHFTAQVDEKLRQVEPDVDAMSGAESLAIKPNTALGENDKAPNDTPVNERV